MALGLVSQASEGYEECESSQEQTWRTLQREQLWGHLGSSECLGDPSRRRLEHHTGCPGAEERHVSHHIHLDFQVKGAAPKAPQRGSNNLKHPNSPKEEKALL